MGKSFYCLDPKLAQSVIETQIKWDIRYTICVPTKRKKRKKNLGE